MTGAADMAAGSARDAIVMMTDGNVEGNVAATGMTMSVTAQEEGSYTPNPLTTR